MYLTMRGASAGYDEKRDEMDAVEDAEASAVSEQTLTTPL